MNASVDYGSPAPVSKSMIAYGTGTRSASQACMTSPDYSSPTKLPTIHRTIDQGSVHSSYNGTPGRALSVQGSAAKFAQSEKKGALSVKEFVKLGSGSSKF